MTSRTGSSDRIAQKAITPQVRDDSSKISGLAANPMLDLPWMPFAAYAVPELLHAIGSAVARQQHTKAVPAMSLQRDDDKASRV